MSARIRIVFVFLLTGLFACKHELPVSPSGNNNNNPGNISGKCNPDSVYFQNDILPILISNCAMSGCHDATTGQEGVRLNNFQNVINTAEIRPGDPNESKLYKVITEKDPEDRMPPAPHEPLNAQQISMIQKWILQGAKNNGCNSGCDTTNVTFSKNIMPLITANCMGCHSGGFPSGGILLTDHASVKTVAQNGRLNGAVNHLPGYVAMPQGGNKLSDCNLKAIKIWIAAGAPNN